MNLFYDELCLSSKIEENQCSVITGDIRLLLFFMSKMSNKYHCEKTSSLGLGYVLKCTPI